MLSSIIHKTNRVMMLNQLYILGRKMKRDGTLRNIKVYTTWLHKG